jgi:hypothetical protein
MLISSMILPWRAIRMRTDSAMIFRQIGGDHHHRETFLDIVLRTIITARDAGRLCLYERCNRRMIHAPIAFHV